MPLAYASSARLKSLLTPNKKPSSRVTSSTRAAQSEQPDSTNNISAEAMQQIQALLAEKGSRTPTEAKIDSQLLQGLREFRGQQIAGGVSLEKTTVNTDANGMILVDMNASVNDDLLSRIEQLGGQIVFPSVEYKAIRAMCASCPG